MSRSVLFLDVKYYISVPSSRIKKFKTLKDVVTGCSKTSVMNSHNMLRNIREKCRSHLLRDVNLKSRILTVSLQDPEKRELIW